MTQVPCFPMPTVHLWAPVLRAGCIERCLIREVTEFSNLKRLCCNWLKGFSSRTVFQNERIVHSNRQRDTKVNKSYKNTHSRKHYLFRIGERDSPEITEIDYQTDIGEKKRKSFMMQCWWDPIKCKSCRRTWKGRNGARYDLQVMLL